MFVTNKNTILTVLVIVLVYVSTSHTAESNSQERNEPNQSADNSITAAPGTKAEQEEDGLTSGDKKSDDSKLDNNKQNQAVNVESNIENNKSDESASQSKPDPQRQFEKVKALEQQGDVQQNQNSDAKLEECSNSESSQKKQTSKTEDENRKTNLNDVNSVTSDETSSQIEKRDIFPNEFLGIPRDASYFFDDLEPFTNHSDNRVGRAAPLHESKIDRIKSGGKGKETVESGLDEVDDVNNNVNEAEKASEEDNEDDEEDEEPDCQPTTACSTTPACTTSSTCSTTTSCTSTTKSSTECKTNAQRKTSSQCRSTTKCPKMCAKANKKQFGNQVTTVNAFEWDSEKKKINNKKRKYHSKISEGD